MVNPRQRKKLKNPGRKITRRTNKKNLRKLGRRGNEIIQGSWDKGKTLRENYAAMGLVSNLNKLPSLRISKKNASGSVACLHAPLDSGDELDSMDLTVDSPKYDHTVIVSARSDTTSNNSLVQMGRIQRDENGNVIGVVMTEDPKEDDTQEPLNDGDDENKNNAIPTKVKTKVVQALEELSKGDRPVVVLPSFGEVKFVEELFSKYGTNYKAMAKDIKVNTFQHTENQIRRKFLKYCEFKGFPTPEDIVL